MIRHTLAALATALLVACGPGGKDDTGDTPDAQQTPLQYKPVVRFESMRFQGFPVRYYVPPDPVGLVWAFHGTNGRVDYVDRIETIAMLNELILNGFAFVATESTEQGPDNQWDLEIDPVENEDLVRLFALREELIALTELTEDTPEYAFGFSNGGGMSGAYAKAALQRGGDVRATAPFLSGGYAWNLDIPVFWSVAVNDPQPAAEEEAALRRAAGLPTQLRYIPEHTITPDWFTRNPAVTLEMSEKTHAEMVRLGMIDEAGHRLVPDDELDAWIGTFEKQAKVSAPTLRSEEIQVAWAMHRMNAWYAREVRDFFLDFL